MYFTQPGVLATTETALALPPMTVPGGSNSEEAPKSIRNPVSLAEDIHVTVVPVLTQNSELPFAPGMLGVAEEECEVRFTSTEHGVEAEPQVLSALQRLAGLGFEQAL